MKKSQKGIVAMVICATMWGLSPVFCTYSYELGNTPFTLAFFRNLFSLPFFYFFVKKEKASLRIEKRQVQQILVAAFFGIFMTTWLLFESYLYISVGTATTLHFLYPCMVLVLSFLIYHDKIASYQWVSVLICLAGIFCFNSGDTNLKGVIMAILSGLFYAIYFIVVEKKNLDQMNPYVLGFDLALFSALLFFVYGSLTHKIVYVQPVQSYLYMILVSIMTSFIGVLCLNYGISTIGSKKASLYCLFEPITGMVFGYFFLHEVISYKQLLGCMLILVGIFYLNFKQKNENDS